ncbi:MAG TPA: hypothetical protein VL147_01130, partial [Devosia sp.]|nr:hypothetical protein [Devosia sp.]
AEAPYQPPRPAETYRPEPVRQEPAREPAIQDVLRPVQPQRQEAAYRPEPQRPVAPQREPEVQTVVAEAAPAASQGDGGWLRDVLRNASAKQASAQPQSLSGLTDEIARSIDDAALADAWARYQAGESNVFSRRIYSLTGQGTYDEVRKKLQRDADFARTAQAYMAEFEQLLKRAAAGPHAAAETRDYLLSDRGKVYTTLAHASGRLN